MPTILNFKFDGAVEGWVVEGVQDNMRWLGVSDIKILYLDQAIMMIFWGKWEKVLRRNFQFMSTRNEKSIALFLLPSHSIVELKPNKPRSGVMTERKGQCNPLESVGGERENDVHKGLMVIVGC